jgi:hypothetical protein
MVEQALKALKAEGFTPPSASSASSASSAL